jgi:hypothetical protein
LLEQAPRLDAHQDNLLTLMRTKGLSIKDLDEDRKDELRRFLDYLHNTKGLSLNDIAKLIGNKTSGYTSWLCKQLGVDPRPFEEARLKGIREKRGSTNGNPSTGRRRTRRTCWGCGTGTYRSRGLGRGSCGSRPARHTRLWRNCSGRCSNGTRTCINIQDTRRTPGVTNGT